MEPNNISIIPGPGGPGFGGLIGMRGERGNVYTNNIYEPGSYAAELLTSLPRAHHARHDSGRDDAPSSCLEGTRVAILSDIMSWLEDANGESPPIYWLSGLAGIGKSTIAKTVADRAQERDMLGASFFFSRSDGPLRDPQRVFPSIAFQLAQVDDAFRNVIIEAVQQDVTLGYQKLLPQLRGLIVAPLLKVDANRRPTLIILDALDECEEGGAAEILRLLFSHGTRIPFLHILVTCRPEPHISSVFEEASKHAKSDLYDIETPVIQHDIRLYLDTELTKIPQKLSLPMGGDWVSEDEMNSLVEKSGKLFVYAATSIRFIGDDRVRDPRRQLRFILSTQTAEEAGATTYTQLDNLYMGVLRNSVFESNRGDILERFQIVVGSIVLLRDPLPLQSLAEFVRYDMDDIDGALYHLRSVIVSPSSDHEAPRIFHSSFRDFIMDGSRCREAGFVIVPVPEQELRHGIRCFELLSEFLKRDVAGLSDASVLNSEVDGFEEKVRDALSPEAQYACRYWTSHLSYVEVGDKKMVGMLDRFSTRSILWWLEAMSLIGSISTAAGSMQEAHGWAMSSKCELTVITMLADARRFVLAHVEVIRASALHVYESALPFTPHDTALYKAYCKEAKDSIQVLQGLESQWPQSLSSLIAHSGTVASVAYSPDGMRLASGSWDRSVRLWDAMSGVPIATLEGHSAWVNSIAYSPNGLQLASASDDRSVRLWDARSGTSIATLEGHSGWVKSVAYSPDGLRLASGSEDCSVRLWDAKSGTSIATLEGHSAAVYSVAFSPNRLRLASGSEDCSVRLWDAISGATIATLEGHSKQVRSVAFSSDGLRLASGSYDRSVRLWDAMSGAPITTLEGHSGPVTSVTYSPDGSQLASGSLDHSVWLWDVRSGATIGTLKGHAELVRCIAFSPDGLQLASGSNDCSVRLWDTAFSAPITVPEGPQPDVAHSIVSSLDGLQLVSGSGDHAKRWDAISDVPMATVETHSGVVTSIVYSPDGLRLASGSEDHSVRLWDTMSGVPIATLEGHSAEVCCVVFSPDGSRLASGSNDCSVQLWDVMSGVLTATLEGHSSPVTSVAYSPDGFQLASGSWDHSVRLWDAMSGVAVATLEGHSKPVRSVAFSSDGLRLASGSWDHSVRLWNTISGMPIATLEGHSGDVWTVSFSPDGLRLASGSDDGSVRLWDAVSGVPIARLECHVEHIHSVAFSIDARTLIWETYAETFAWDLSPQPPYRLDSKPSAETYPSSTGLSRLIWSHNDQWIQMRHPLEKSLRRICYIPPSYSLTTQVKVISLPSHSRIALGCSEGRIVILDIQHHPFSI